MHRNPFPDRRLQHAPDIILHSAFVNFVRSGLAEAVCCRVKWDQRLRLPQAEWPKHVILRASIIVGPQSPVPVARPLFLQFIVQQLAEHKATTFFTDEFRNPTYVRDIVQMLVKLIAEEEKLHGRCAFMSGASELCRQRTAGGELAAGPCKAWPIYDACSTTYHESAGAASDVCIQECLHLRSVSSVCPSQNVE